jgi:hypothetical protein
MKKILLSFAALAAVATMYAESDTYSVNDAVGVEGTHNETVYKTDSGGNATTEVSTYENYSPVTALELGDYSFSFSIGDEGKTQPAYYNSKTGDWTIRLYTGNTMTIESPNNLSSIAFAFASAVTNFSATVSAGSGFLSTDNATYTWNRPEDSEEEIKTLTFTIGKNCRISSVTFSSEVAAEPETVSFNKVSSVIDGADYLLYFAQQTDDSSLSCILNPLAASANYGYLYPTDVTVEEDGCINAYEAQAFKLTSVVGEDETTHYTIQDASGRYYYMSGTYNSFNISADRQTDNSDLWDVTFNENGYALIKNVANEKTLQYSVQYKSAGAYAEVSESNLLPTLYTSAEVPVVISYPEKIWLIGQPEGWDINGKDEWTLSQESEGVYSGTFTINKGDGMFRFYTAVGDWETNSIGAQETDNPVDIELSEGVYSGSAVAGKGSWNLSTWEGGQLDITVDLVNMTVRFAAATDNSGVSSIAADNSAAEYYTISGIRVDGNNLNSGLYIKRVNGKAQKVLVRK